MPCARVPETRLSTPPPAPGRPPAAATLIRPGGNLKTNEKPIREPLSRHNDAPHL